MTEYQVRHCSERAQTFFISCQSCIQRNILRRGVLVYVDRDPSFAMNLVRLCHEVW